MKKLLIMLFITFSLSSNATEQVPVAPLESSKDHSYLLDKTDRKPIEHNRGSCIVQLGDCAASPSIPIEVCLRIYLNCIVK